MIIVNGRLLAQGSQFGLNDVEIITANVNLQDIRSYRIRYPRHILAARHENYPRVQANICLARPEIESGDGVNRIIAATPDVPVRYHSLAEEIQYAPALWMWDYLRRSRQAGYFLPLSGGIDSASTAVLVYSMCRMVYAAITSDETLPRTKELVLSDCRRVCAQAEDWLPSSPQDICGHILHTTYMGLKNSSNETRSRTSALAKAIGAYHTDVNINTVVGALTTLLTTVTGFTPSGSSENTSEGLALQNVQARMRTGV